VSLPLAAIIEAVYDRLSGELSESVGYAGSVTGTKYVAIQVPAAVASEKKTSETYDTTISIRCHTEYDRGQRQPLTAANLAQSVNTAMESNPLPLTGHVNLYLNAPDLTESTYQVGNGRDAHDIILTYEIITQQTP
jgi:hypothetical protein